ncbi:lyase family protein [Brevibacillus sp. WF146]|uniref:argininosuccinate lyase n=1 Tax=Brevibacillus sp. WF146 TaxID=319501 RepID=UPI0007ED1A5B|nr:lyase family protein [Brevibacillus sp. WF146]UYZ11974.1 lyase family protein [Brevibacillus sp. WF146]
MQARLTGRVKNSPHDTYTTAVLNPQFEYELHHYFDHYIQIEAALLRSYETAMILTKEEVRSLLKAIQGITKETLLQSSKENMTDMAFTLERSIENRLEQPVVKWHIDRSRNDFQACAQLMYAREQWVALIEKVQMLRDVILDRANMYHTVIMPGYTHFQSAQIISVSFYLTAISKHLLETEKRMIAALEAMNTYCPLGSGAMSGQEYPVDNLQLARSLGFTSYIGHALSGVASRDWLLDIGSCLAFFANNMSRFLTDLMNWGSSEYQFIDFPDELAGISSSMPQKRNFPILERARGKTAHLLTYYVDFLLGQRNTAYSNLVEVSKESSKNLLSLFQEMQVLLDLLMLVFENIQFQSEKMKQCCTKDYYGGFSLANRITEKSGIPYRQAQVIAGQFITQSIQAGQSPQHVSVEVLQEICREHGFVNRITQQELQSLFGLHAALTMKRSAGSTNPDAVKDMIVLQTQEAAQCKQVFSRIATDLKQQREELARWMTSEGKEYDR